MKKEQAYCLGIPTSSSSSDYQADRENKKTKLTIIKLKTKF